MLAALRPFECGQVVAPLPFHLTGLSSAKFDADFQRVGRDRMRLVQGLFAHQGGRVYAKESWKRKLPRINLIIDKFVAAFGEKRQIFDAVVEIVADFLFWHGEIFLYFWNVKE